MTMNRIEIGTLVSSPTFSSTPTPDSIVMHWTSTARITMNQRVICFSSRERAILARLGSARKAKLTTTAMSSIKPGIPKQAISRLE